jgi:multidrug efflux pump subunit AcrB
VARIERARAPATQYSSTDGRDAISLAINKKAGSNTLELVDRLRAFIAEENAVLAASGLRMTLADDQTIPTREAIKVMQTNALYGVIMVLAVCWLFLGAKIGVLVSLGIPFSLLGTFALLAALGHTVNVSVLLGVVIALGLLVDDAVVIVEATYYRIERGQEALQASLDAIGEVWAPVLASVATTMAAFLPLMLLPGIVGKFMFVIPFVVTLALLISLLEAFWMMPVHIVVTNMRLDQPSRLQLWRNRFNRRIRLRYGQALAYALRRPKRFAALTLAAVVVAVGLVASGVIRIQFFAFDPIRIIYVNVDMPATATLEDTLAETQAVEQVVRSQLKGVGADAEARSVYANAGVKFTDNEPLYGDPYGQVIVSLNPAVKGARDVSATVEAMRASVAAVPGLARKSFTVLSGGPPAGKAISVKVRGDDFARLQAAADALKEITAAIPGARDVQDDNVPGRPQLVLRLDRDALRKTGLNAAQLARQVRIAIDGEVVAFTRDEGDKTRSSGALRACRSSRPGNLPQRSRSPCPTARSPASARWSKQEIQPGRGFIRHYNLRRTVTVEASLDKELTDTAAANALIASGWEKIRAEHPGVSLDFSGELEDIEESLDAMKILFLLGVGLIYLILAAQFASYWQPLMILVSVPLAFTGVAFGLALSEQSAVAVHAVRRDCADRHRGQLGDRPDRRRQRPPQRGMGGHARPDPGRAAAGRADPDHHDDDHRRPLLACFWPRRQEPAVGAGGLEHRLGAVLFDRADAVCRATALSRFHARAQAGSAGSVGVKIAPATHAGLDSPDQSALRLVNCHFAGSSTSTIR